MVEESSLGNEWAPRLVSQWAFENNWAQQWAELWAQWLESEKRKVLRLELHLVTRKESAMARQTVALWE